MGRLGIADAGWLLIEERERPMHHGGLQLFEAPEDADPRWIQELIAGLRRRDDVRPPFNHRLRRPYGRAGIYHWVEDEVELDYHFRHIALPEPGRVRELLALVSSLHGNLLDRHRPLWESYLIEGLEGRRFASYTKIHHSVLDGVAAMRQLHQSFSTDPDERDLPPPWAARELAEAAADTSDDEGGPSVPNPLSAAWRAVARVAGGGASTVGLARTVMTQIARSTVDDSIVAPFDAPRSMLNQNLTGARRFVAQSYDFDRIRGVGKALDATVNDVVLAMCSTALRTYLRNHDALPRKPLIALVPVSFRRDDSDSGNSISLVPANLATHLDDPGERMGLIQDSMLEAKDRVRRLNPTQMIQYGLVMTAPIVLGNLTGVSGMFAKPSYNLVISNVPGPSQPLYWNGARMTGLYPLSLLTEGYAINITQTSYAGSMEFGITADRKALPSVQRLIDHLEEGLVELEKLAGV